MRAASGPARGGELTLQGQDSRHVAAPGRRRGLLLDLLEPGLFITLQVLLPDRVCRIDITNSAQDRDTLVERCSCQSEPAMFPEQVLERVVIRIGRIELGRRLHVEHRRQIETVQVDQLHPFRLLGEVEHRHRVEQVWLRVRRVDRFAPESLLDQPAHRASLEFTATHASAYSFARAGKWSFRLWSLASRKARISSMVRA